MAPTSVFDLNQTATSLAHIQEAMSKINALLSKKLNKTLFRDMLMGFKILLESLTRKEENAFETVIQWLQLLLKVQSALDPKDDKLREQFEKIVPPAVTYVIGCLQNKSPNMPTFHYQLLEMTHILLSRVKPITVEKLANLETGIIACLWFPVDFVGDFNTQMMALRLLTKLLKCVDDMRLQSELDQIQCPQRDMLKAKLNSAIIVTNYHEGIFDNVARTILNNYNMNMAKHVLVYSFRCKTVRFDEHFEFFKTLNADKFWVDLNYCPRTLTFTGRYRENKLAKFTNVSVACFVRSLQLKHHILTVQLKPPVHFSEGLNNLLELQNFSNLKLQLPTEEAMRLKENYSVLEYYNNTQQEAVLCPNLLQNNEPESASYELNKIQSEGNGKYNAKATTILDESSLKNNINNNFQKSYEFLIGPSESIEKHSFVEPQIQSGGIASFHTTSSLSKTKSTFDCGTSHKYEQVLHKKKSIRIQGKFRKLNATSALLPQSLVPESPKTSRRSKTRPKQAHPILELCAKRRFFKTTKRSWDRNTKSTSKKSRTNRISRNNTNSKEIPSTLKPKQINKVKPMTHVDRKHNEPGESEAKQECQGNSAIINITSFLDKGHESATVFNEAQGCTEVKNIPRKSVALGKAVRTDVPKILPTAQVEPPTITDIYENRDVSDAEPGQSYRVFRTRQHIPNELSKNVKFLQNSKPKTAAVRKRRIVEKCQTFDENMASTSRAAAAAAASAVTNATTAIRKSRKRTNTKSQQLSHASDVQQKEAEIAFSKLKDDFLLTAPPVKSPRLKRANGIRTVYSADIEIDLTCSPPHENICDAANNPVDSYMRSNRSICPKLLPGIRALSPFTVKSDDEEDLKYINKDVDAILHNIDKDTESMECSEIQTCRKGVIYPKELSPMIPCWNIISPGSDGKSASIELQEPTSLIDVSHLPVTTHVERMVQPNYAQEHKHMSEECSENAQTTQTMFDCMQSTNQETNFKDVHVAANLSKNECILFRGHSDSESSAELEAACDINFNFPQNTETNFSTPKNISVRNVATKTITEHQVTAISTSIVTRHTRLVSREVFAIPTIGLATSPAPIGDIVSNGVEQIACNCSLANAMEDLSTTSILRYENGKELTLTPTSLKGESLGIIEAYKKDFLLEYESLIPQVKKKCVDAFVKKVADISRCILNEAEKEREELEELERIIERIVRQLEWQYEAFQKKSEKFKCFRENIDNILQALSEMNVSEEIDSEFDQLLEELQISSREKSTKQWGEFVQESAKDIVKNLSELSKL